MPGKGARVTNQTIRLEGPSLQFANLLAARYGVTLQQLIEALVLGCAERDGVGGREVNRGPSAKTPVATRSTQRCGNVIYLSESRVRRRAKRKRPPTCDGRERRERSADVVERSQRARAMAEAACKMAEQVRRRADEVKAQMAWFAQQDFGAPEAYRSA